MARLDDAEPYFGKPGEIIVCNLSGSRTIPRMENSYRETQESPRPQQLEMRYPSSTTPPRSSGYNSNAGNYQYQQTTGATYGGPQQHSGYENQGAFRQTAAAPSYAASSASSRQYPARDSGFYGSSASSQFF
ncbi:uncharacterized protein PAC_11540 [Phialocephala subalpina]|uniref:Uncharacterized protein n=1 Tax=Phialocephala subalpina TaxID=576137 RepID=A0A1L7X9D8_9HELO|nr:uncharacterized protein PAC_11540 [Phialocephala subalpina]